MKSATQTTTRPVHAKAKKTVAHPTVAHDPGVLDRVMSRFQEAQAELMATLQVPSWKRVLCAFLAAVCVSALVGWVAGYLITWLAVGAFLFTASSFLFYAIWLAGLLIAMYYGGKLAGRCAGAVLTGEIDERAVAARDSVKNFFTAINPFNKTEAA